MQSVMEKMIPMFITPVFLIMILLSGALLVQSQKSKIGSPSNSQKSTQVLGENNATPSPVGSQNLEVITQPKIIQTPSPTSSDTKSTSSDLNSFKYPEATNLSSSTNSLNLESADDPQVITDWYKEKIRALGMNTKNFVQTKTNGDISNKLVGVKDNFEIAIEIKKSKNNQKTTINIKLDT